MNKCLSDQLSSAKLALDTRSLDAAMSEMIVYKLDENGREVLHYPARVLARSETHVRLEAFFSRDDMDLGYTTLKRGDRFIEYFYTDRWYNVFAIYDRDDGNFKGWYCNICRPSVIGETAVYCEDLALDIWIDPQGQATVLDEEEFINLTLSPKERKAAQSTFADLLETNKKHQLPQ